MSRAITSCGCPTEHGRGHEDRCPTLRALTWPDGKPKIAPVQGYIQGIPWSLQLEAYDAYVKRWSRQAALIDLDRRGCRGGFGTGELDELIPGWRDRVGEIAALREALKPFAEVCEQISDDESDEEWAKFRLLVKNFRRARDVLAGRV